MNPTARLAADQRLNRAVDKYCRPRAGEVLLLVAHGNLIRALVCRALGTRLSLWHRMRINHCSITELEIGPEGEVYLIRFNDTGFMPHSMRTM